MNTVFAAGTFFTPGTIEKFGRRAILLWSAVALTVLMLVFTVLVNLGGRRTENTQWAAVGMVVAFVFVLGYGWVGVPWLYGPEASPATRALGKLLTACADFSTPL